MGGGQILEEAWFGSAWLEEGWREEKKTCPSGGSCGAALGSVDVGKSHYAH